MDLNSETLVFVLSLYQTYECYRNQVAFNFTDAPVKRYSYRNSERSMPHNTVSLHIYALLQFCVTQESVKGRNRSVCLSADLLFFNKPGISVPNAKRYRSNLKKQCQQYSYSLVCFIYRCHS